MKVITNITNTSFDMDRYIDSDDIRAFCEKHQLDGLELLPYFTMDLNKIPEDAVVGVHLSFITSWVDFWKGNDKAVLEEYGSQDIIDQVIGQDRLSIINNLKRQLDFAEKIKAEYVVFHVTNVTLEECVSYDFKHTDTEVIDASIELINSVLDTGCYSFHFLVENLWWPGFKMTDPALTHRLLDGINYKNAGIMLDIGHLLHTDDSIGSLEEGMEYINSCLDAHRDILHRIIGVHLHQSLTGAFVRGMISSPPKLEGSYYDKLGRIYEYIPKLDTHQPFGNKIVRGIIDRLSLKYLTHEFTTRTREEHDEYLICQMSALLM